MEKKMLRSEIEETELNSADVITTSGPMTNAGDDNEENYGGLTEFGEL